MEEPVNICFVFDEKFADLFKVAILSIDRNTTSPLAAYIVDCGISEEKKQELLEFRKQLHNVQSITFGSPQRIDVIENYKMPTWFSSAIFYRLQIPKIFPELKRVIYLDCDVIATGDIVELWNENLDGRPFGAVEEDENLYEAKARITRKKKLKIPVERNYYSSGVLLINTGPFEKAKIFDRVIEILKNHKVKLECPEQDAMNVCLENDEHVPLSPKYNFSPFAPLAKKCIQNIKKPVLIHYSMAKPWNINKSLIQIFHKLHICRYSTTMILKYWKYADEIDRTKYSQKSYKATLKFLYKRLFQPIEYFVAKGIRDNMLRFLKVKK